MKVEILFSELYLYGDLFNAKFLTKMLPQADFYWTSYQEEPAFAKEKVDLIYIGSLPDHLHGTILTKLRPYLSRLTSLLEGSTILFASGNAADLLGQSLDQDGRVTQGLGLAPYRSKGSLGYRYNSWLMGTFASSEGPIPVIGNKSEFSLLYMEDTTDAFFTLKQGLGLNHEGKAEGYHKGNIYATKMLGPFFIMNPLFSEYFLRNILGVKDGQLPYKEELLTAFHARSKTLLENIQNNFTETNIQRVE